MPETDNNFVGRLAEADLPSRFSPDSQLSYFVVKYTTFVNNAKVTEYYQCQGSESPRKLVCLGDREDPLKDQFSLVFEAGEKTKKKGRLYPLKGYQSSRERDKSCQDLMHEAEAYQNVANVEGDESPYQLAMDFRDPDGASQKDVAGYLWIDESQGQVLSSQEINKLPVRHVIFVSMPRLNGVLGSKYVKDSILNLENRENAESARLDLLEAVLKGYQRLWAAGRIPSDFSPTNFVMAEEDNEKICLPIDFGDGWRGGPDGGEVGVLSSTYPAVDNTVDREAGRPTTSAFFAQRLLVAMGEWYAGLVGESGYQPLIYDRNFFGVNTTPSEMFHYFLDIVHLRQRRPLGMSEETNALLKRQHERFTRLQTGMKEYRDRLNSKNKKDGDSEKCLNVQSYVAQFDAVVTDLTNTPANLPSCLFSANTILRHITEIASEHRRGLDARAGAKRMIEFINKSLFLKMVLLFLVVIGWIIWAVPAAINAHKSSGERLIKQIKSNWVIGYDNEDSSGSDNAFPR